MAGVSPNVTNEDGLTALHQVKSHIYYQFPMAYLHS